MRALCECNVSRWTHLSGDPLNLPSKLHQIHMLKILAGNVPGSPQLSCNITQLTVPLDSVFKTLRKRLHLQLPSHTSKTSWMLSIMPRRFKASQCRASQIRWGGFDNEMSLEQLIHFRQAATPAGAQPHPRPFGCSQSRREGSTAIFRDCSTPMRNSSPHCSGAPQTPLSGYATCLLFPGDPMAYRIVSSFLSHQPLRELLCSLFRMQTSLLQELPWPGRA